MKIPFSNTGGYKALALVLVLAILGMLDMLFHTKYLRKVIGEDSKKKKYCFVVMVWELEALSDA